MDLEFLLVGLFESNDIILYQIYVSSEKKI